VDGDGQQQQPFNGHLSGTTRVGQYQKKQYQKKHGWGWIRIKTISAGTGGVGCSFCLPCRSLDRDSPNADIYIGRQ